MRYLGIIVLFVFGVALSGASAETRLMMVEAEDCPWCKRWNHDVGGEYHLTDEGKAAPLLRHDITHELPNGISLDSRPHFTPTFILLEDGREVNRLEGYPGEDFFWGLLGMMLEGLSQDDSEASDS